MSKWVSSEVRRSRRRRAGTEHSMAIRVIMWPLDDPSNPPISNLVPDINCVNKRDFSLYSARDIE